MIMIIVIFLTDDLNGWAKINGFGVNLISKNNLHEYILEIDLEYPDE